MSWYKIEIHYGPGHMGTCIEYEWSNTKLDLTIEHHVDFKNEMIDRVKRNNWIDEFQDPISRFEEVDALPVDVIKEKKERFLDKIQYAQKMIDILGQTKTF